MKTKNKYTIKQRKLLKDKAWVVFSKWIRNRDNHTCVTCGKDRNFIQKNGKPISIHSGHFCHNREDFNPKNIHAQCMGCNWKKKGNMRYYTIRMIEWYGIKYVKQLMLCEKEKPRLESGEFYENIIKRYS